MDEALRVAGVERVEDVLREPQHGERAEGTVSNQRGQERSTGVLEGQIRHAVDHAGVEDTRDRW